MKCRLCYLETKSGIEIYSSQGVKLTIASILNQHFALQLVEDDIYPKIICKKCWKITDQFHKLYCTVQEIETTLKLKESGDITSTIEPIIDSEIKQENEVTESGLISTDLPLTHLPLLDDVKIEDLPKTTEIDGNVSVSYNRPHGDHKSVKIAKIKIKRISKRKRNILQKDFIEQSARVAVNKNFVSKEKIMLQEEIIINELELKCDICSEKSTSFANLKSHIRSNHNITGYIKCCGKKFFRRGTIYAHIRDHNSFGKYKCDKCEKIFIDKARLDAHTYLHDPSSRKYPCSICTKRFLSPSTLTDHLISVHRSSDARKDFICDICQKAFITKKWLSSHMNSHTQKYYQICDICARVFNSRKLLDEHYKTQHMGIPLRKHQCTFCGKWLASNSGLTRHMRVHNAKEETCNICGKNVPNINSLNDHIRYVHSGRIFKCQMCMKILKSQTSLKEHIASHTGISLYKCPYCSMEFNSGGNMRKHKKNMHPIDFEKDRDKKVNNYLGNISSL